MPPAEKPKAKAQNSKKRTVTAIKPNPRTPNIIKIKINNPRLKVTEPAKQPVTEPELVTPKDCNLRKLKKEHSLLLANAVANTQLGFKSPTLINDAMVEITADQMNNKKTKKRSLSLVKTPPNITANKKPATKQKEPKMPKKRKAANKCEVKEKKPKLNNQSPSDVKKKKGRKKTTLEGKQEVKNKIFNLELLDQLKNFGNSSPLTEKAVDDQKISRSSSVDNFRWAEEISTSNGSTITGLGLSSPVKSQDNLEVLPSPVGTRNNSTEVPSSTHKTHENLVVIDGRLPMLMLIDCKNMIEDETMMKTPEPTTTPHLFESPISKSLSLSTSSSSSSEPEMTEMEKALETVRQKINCLDLEFINWLNDGEDTEPVDLQSKILKHEIEGIKECQMCRQITISRTSSESEKAMTPAVSPLRAMTPAVSPLREEPEPEKPVLMTEIPEEDEDAISLYAESLTGIESSTPYRRRSKFCSYKEIEQTEAPKAKIVCEKQNADSTVNKDEKSLAINLDLIASQYTPISPTKSKIFSGVCFFNLANMCRNKQCNFPHVEITSSEVLNRLNQASEEVLFQDYILVRNYPHLRNRFLDLFAMECVKRGLTRALLEMAFDSHKAIPPVKTVVLETTLDYIQKIDLSTYEDILQIRDSLTKMMLCDFLMEAIADTCNLGRLVSVFICLVDFIVKLGTEFQLCVALKVLERICLLPYQEKLSKALILVIKNTDSGIFESDAMVKFEERLLECNGELYEELLEYKNMMVEAPPAMFPQPVAEKKRYTSPDTTNLEKLKIDGPIIKRTINTNSTRTIMTNQPVMTGDRPTMSTNLQNMSNNRPNMSTDLQNMSTNLQNMSNNHPNITRPNMSTNRPNMSNNRPNMSTNRPGTANLDFKIPKLRAPRGQMRGLPRPNFGQQQMFGHDWGQARGKYRRFPRNNRGGRGGNYQRRPRQDFF